MSQCVVANMLHVHPHLSWDFPPAWTSEGCEFDFYVEFRSRRVWRISSSRMRTVSEAKYEQENSEDELSRVTAPVNIDLKLEIHTAQTIFVFPVSTYAEPLAWGTRPVFKTIRRILGHQFLALTPYLAEPCCLGRDRTQANVHIGRMSSGFLPSLRREVSLEMMGSSSFLLSIRMRELVSGPLKRRRSTPDIFAGPGRAFVRVGVAIDRKPSWTKQERENRDCKRSNQPRQKSRILESAVK